MDPLQYQQLTYGQPCDPARATPLRVTAHLLERLPSRRGHIDCVALSPKPPAERLARTKIVVHDQDTPGSVNW